MVTLSSAWRSTTAHPPLAPSNLLVRAALQGSHFPPEKMRLHRSGPQTSLPTNPTQKIPKQTVKTTLAEATYYNPGGSAWAGVV